MDTGAGENLLLLFVSLDIFFSLLPAVCAGTDADLPLKGGGKIVGAVKAYGFRHSTNALSLAQQKAGAVHLHT